LIKEPAVGWTPLASFSLGRVDISDPTEIKVSVGLKYKDDDTLPPVDYSVVRVKIHSDCSKANLDEMRGIYKSVGWTRNTNDIIKQIYEASNVVAIATINGQTVGLGRAISDGVFNAAIYDVVVRSEFQKQGIAKKIINYLLENLSHVSCVHLISTIGNEDLYHKLGFKKVRTGMARYLNPILSDEYLE
jgi:GNAT superfamily N-acetyltransferase